MKKLISPVTALIVLLALFFPMTAYGTESGAPGGVGTIQIEYRYYAGETPNIPKEINQFGRVYYLVSQSEPVLESTLPTTRTYTYHVEGYLTPEEIAAVEAIGNITITPIDVVFEREADVEIVFPNSSRPGPVLTNDVDDIPRTWACRVTSGKDPSGHEYKDFERVGVSYKLATPRYDEDGLPSGYVATVIYRGIETYKSVGYYYVSATFTTTEDEDERAVYVIVAEYQTEEIPPQVSTLIPDTAEPAAAPEGISEAVMDQGPNPFANIIQGLVPLGNVFVQGFWSVLSAIFALAGIAIAVIYLIGARSRRARVKVFTNLGVYDEERLKMIKTRGALLRILTMIIGAITFVVWLYLEDFNSGMVWINSGTAIVGALLLLTIILSAVTNIHNRKVISDEGSEEDDMNYAS